MSKSTTKPNELRVGSRVLTGTGFSKKGEIRFIGEMQFSPGEWIGIRLDTPDGRNDGTVANVRYFECEPDHGLFVKSRSQVKPEPETVAKVGVTTRSGRSSVTGTTASNAPVKTTTSTSGIPSKIKVKDEVSPKKPTIPVKKTETKSSGDMKTKSTDSILTPTNASSTSQAPSEEASVRESVTPEPQSQLNNNTIQEVEALQTQIQQLQENEEKSQAQISQLQESEVLLQSTIQELHEKIRVLEEQVAIKPLFEETRTVEPTENAGNNNEDNNIKSNYEEELNKLKLEIKSLQEDNDKLIEEMQLHDDKSLQQKNDYEQSLIDINTLLHDKEEENKRLQQQLLLQSSLVNDTNDLNTKQVDELTIEMEKLKIQHTKDQQEIELLENQLLSIKQELAASSSAANKLTPAPIVVDNNEEVLQLQQTNQSLTSQISSLQQQVLDLQESEKLMDETIKLQNQAEEESKQEIMKLENIKNTQEKQIASLKHNLDKLHEDLKIAKGYEVKVNELTAANRALQFEKEELMLEYELISEQLKNADDEIKSLKSSGGGSSGSNDAPSVDTSSNNTNSIAALQASNKQLREQVRKLMENEENDREMISTQTSIIDDLEAELNELRELKDRHVATIDEMKQTIDSVSDYESMIEQLTEQKLDLSAQLDRIKGELRDLEETHEICEELDQTQREQIDKDRRLIDDLNTFIVNQTQAIEQRDNNITELQSLIEKLKQTNKQLLQDIEQLTISQSADSIEWQRMEMRIKEANLLKSEYQAVIQEKNVLLHHLESKTIEKYKFEALYKRYDHIFGNNAVFLEESKLLNKETMYLQTITTGMNAMKVFAGFMYSSLLHPQENILTCFASSQQQQQQHPNRSDDNSASSDSSVAVDVQKQDTKEYIVCSKWNHDMIRKCYDLNSMLLQVLGFIIHSNLHLFTTEHLQNDHNNNTIVQFLMTIKTYFEQIIVTSNTSANYLKVICNRLKVNNDNKESMIHNSNELTEDEFSTMTLKLTDITRDYDTIVHDMKDLLLSVQLSSNNNGDNINALATPQKSSNTKNVYNVFKSADISDIPLLNTLLFDEYPNIRSCLQQIMTETFILSLNNKCDEYLYYDKVTRKQQLIVEGGSIQNNDYKELLKSIKIELQQTISIFKQFSSQLSASHSQYRNAFVSLCSVSNAKGLIYDALTVNTLKTVLSLVRKIKNSAMSSNSNNNNISLSTTMDYSTSMGQLRYYPHIFLCSAECYFDIENRKDIVRRNLSDQYHNQIEKYWLLILQGGGASNDLLFDNTTANTTSANSTVGLTTLSVAWKKRVEELKNIVKSRLGGLEAASTLSLTPSNISAKSNSNSATTSSSSQQPLNDAKYQSLVSELNTKRDELQAAMNKCHELENELDQAQQKIASLKNSDVVMKGLEKALDEAERKLEESGRESRQLKQQIQQLGGGVLSHNSTVSNSPVPFTNESSNNNLAARVKAERRKSSVDTKASLSNLFDSVATLSSTQQSHPPLPHLHHHHSSSSASLVSSSHHSHFIDEQLLFAQLTERVAYWKHVALKRLTSSLKPLPLPPTFTSSTSGTKQRNSITTNTVSDSGHNSNSSSSNGDESKQMEFDSNNDLQHNEHNVIKMLGMSFPDYKVDDTSVRQLKTLQHKIRLARASAKYIKLIDVNHHQGEEVVGVNSNRKHTSKENNKKRNHNNNTLIVNILN